MKFGILLLALLYSCKVSNAQNIKNNGPFSERLAWAKKNNKYGFQNQQGELVIPYKYDSVFSFSEGLAAVKLDTNWFYITKEDSLGYYNKDYGDQDEEVRIYPMFKSARPFYHNIAVVKSHNNDYREYELLFRGGYTDMFGDYHFDSIGDFKTGFAEIVQGNKHGIIDTIGDYVVPAKFEDVDSFSNGWVKVKQDGQWMVLNPYGACVQNCVEDKKLPKKYNSSYHRLYFPNVISDELFDEITKFKLASLISFMERNPQQRMVITGNGNHSYVSQQRSWDYVYSIIEYVLGNSSIKREQFIFQYGRNGPYRTVDIRKARNGEDGPSNLPPPFPSFTR